MPPPVLPPLQCPPDRYVALRATGPDAGSFLQGQLTQDVLAVEPGALALSAYATPQGRVIAVAWLERCDDGYRVLLHHSLAAAVRERLHRYVLRAKVRLEPAPLEPATARALAAEIGGRQPSAPPEAAVDERWALALVRAGHPEVLASVSETWVPQMLNLDLLAAIGFRKGCYTGQEIVARTQHLGRIKRRMLRFAAAIAPPAPGAAVLADGQKVGEVVLAAPAAGGSELLAVVNLDARERPLELDGAAALAPLPLPYPVP